MDRCSNCGADISQEQLVLALEDAGETDPERMTLMCSDYTEDAEQGHLCQANDPQALPYWESRG